MSSSQNVLKNTFEIFSSAEFRKTFINKNHTLNKTFNLSIFNDSQPEGVISNN